MRAGLVDVINTTGPSQANMTRHLSCGCSPQQMLQDVRSHISQMRRFPSGSLRDGISHDTPVSYLIARSVVSKSMLGQLEMLFVLFVIRVVDVIVCSEGEM